MAIVQAQQKLATEKGSMGATARALYELTKPGIIYGNAITAAAGFLFASAGTFNAGLFLAMLVGISLVMASGCTFNNYIDQDIDALMMRTKNRPLVRGVISNRAALVFGSALGVLGILTLVFFVNTLVAGIALFGWAVYVVLYSLLWKRYSVFGTLIGSLSGAVPPVVGYVAVRGEIDLGAMLLFAILALWQMPHSYAIALYRKEDYTAAHIPVLPIKKGAHVTKIHSLFYIASLLVAMALLYMYGYANMNYLVIVTALGLGWLAVAARGFFATNNTHWARSMFFYSLVMVIGISIALSAGAL